MLAVLYVVSLTAASATSAASDGTPQSAGGGGNIINVSIQNFAYNPASIQISTGDTVK